MKRRQRCSWHWLAKQPADVQERAAQRRLSRVPEERRRSRVPAAKWPDGGRWCSGCQSMVPLFYCSGSRCRACASRASHRAAVEKKYGVTAAEYDRLFELQGGRCAICRQRPRSKRLALDHDHKTGEPRGLLCSGKDRSGCNVALGIFHDDVEILRRAVDYLECPPAAGEVVGPDGVRRAWKKPAAAVRDDGPPPF